MSELNLRSAGSKVTIEKSLFGHNLEHTRSSIFKGLSAQIIRNRKFAGKPACRTGEAAEWYKIGPDNVFLTLDPRGAYTKHNTPERISGVDKNEVNFHIIQNPIQGQTAGIGQGFLELQSGRQYDARVVLKYRSDIPPTVRVVIKGACGSVYSDNSFAPGTDWQTFSFSFPMPSAPSNDSDARLEITTDDRCEVGVGAVSLMPADNFRGMRTDVIQHMKEIGITLLRWPGGNFAGDYYWKDGLLDVDMRAPQMSYMAIETLPHTQGYDTHEINTDDFIALCREIGAEPYITVNLAWDSPEECAQWVEYCNGSPDTPWGKKRAERGAEKPYNVKFWSLGNEFGYGHMEGLNTPEGYTDKALACAKAMKEADPSIVLFASGPYYWGTPLKIWVQESIPRLTEYVSYLSYHFYLHQRRFENGLDFVTDKGLKDCFNFIVNAPYTYLKDLENTREFMQSVGGKTADIGIAFDEWNIFFAWYRNPGVMEGIYTALMLEMFCNNFDRLNMDICMYFEPVNEGAINVFPFESELNANGQVFKLMKNHIDGTRIDVETSDTDLRCLATYHGNEHRITVINRSYDTEKKVNLPAGTQGAKALLYHGKSLLCASRFEISEVKPDSGFTLPAHSILHIVYNPVKQ